MSTLLSPLLDLGILTEQDVSEQITAAKNATTLEELVAIQNEITVLSHSKIDGKEYKYVRPEWVAVRRVHNDSLTVADAEIAILRAKSDARQEIVDTVGTDLSQEAIDIVLSVDQEDIENIDIQLKIEEINKIKKLKK